jgi:hypothetical protein
MLTDEDWRTVYDYLLRRMSAIGETSSVVVELQEVTRLRLENDLEAPQPKRRGEPRRRAEIQELGRDLFAMGDVEPPTISVKGRSGDSQDLDLARNRAPRPREAFYASVDVLIARLRECPAISTRLQELFRRTPESLQWLPDASEEEFAAAQESFDGLDFTLSESERAEIEKVLQRLQVLLEEER